MKRINLVIFNEEFWTRGLIYSQNILPLVKLHKSKGTEARLISFTSVFKYISNYRKIKNTKFQLKEKGIDCINFPVLFYPTRLLLVKWFLLPFFYINVFPYIKYLECKDKKQNINIYNLRSYQIALGFYNFYNNKENLYFDLRTDWIEENINCGNFQEDTKTVRFWRKLEKKMLTSFKKSLFISQPFLHSVLSRNKIKYDRDKYVITYNPIDYSRFFSHSNKENKEINFLYTGSLGHWNNIETYLDFFNLIHKGYPDSKLIICTNTPFNKIENSIKLSKYDNIRDKIELHFNIPYASLPKFYAKCSYGLQLMCKKDSRVGVKYVEYIASGIIPIVHENVLGAAQLVSDYDLGVVVSDSDLHNARALIEKINNAKPINRDSENYRNFRNVTDVETIDSRLSEVYELDS